MNFAFKSEKNGLPTQHCHMFNGSNSTEATCCEVRALELMNLMIFPKTAFCHPAGKEENPGGGHSLSSWSIRAPSLLRCARQGQLVGSKRTRCTTRARLEMIMLVWTSKSFSSSLCNDQKPCLFKLTEYLFFPILMLVLNICLWAVNIPNSYNLFVFIPSIQYLSKSCKLLLIHFILSQQQRKINVFELL